VPFGTRRHGRLTFSLDSMPTVLRRAKPQDAEQVAEILITARRAFMPFAPSAHTDPEVRQWSREVLLPTHEVTVATEAGQIVGVLACSRKGEHSWIDQLMLHPAAVGRGIGSQLLEHAIATMPLPVRLYTFQPHVRARKFYERHGFVAIEFTDGRSNEEGVPDVLYELNQAPYRSA